MGYAFAVGSAALSSARDAVSKRVSATVDGVTSTFASSAFALPFYLVLLLAAVASGHETLRFTPALLGLALLRSTSDVLGETLKMRALVRGNLSVVASFLSLSPIFLLLVFPLVTGEGVSLAGGAGVSLAAGGSLILLARRAAPPGQGKSALLAACASILFAANACVDGLVVRHATPLLGGFSITAVSSLVLSPFVVPSAARRRALRAGARDLALRGLFETAYMIMKLWALQSLQAPYVVAIQRLSLLVSIVAGRVLFAEKDLGRRLAAGACILAGVLLVVLRG